MDDTYLFFRSRLEAILEAKQGRWTDTARLLKVSAKTLEHWLSGTLPQQPSHRLRIDMAYRSLVDQKVIRESDGKYQVLKVRARDRSPKLTNEMFTDGAGI